MSTIIFDSTPSKRSIDENGFMHVSMSHITRAVVNPYYGREIPGWEARGLDPDSIYYGYRHPDELKASVGTWEGLPLHIEHHVDSAEEPARLSRVGAVGKAVWNPPYIDAPLTIWDGDAIAAIEDGSYRELSCAYRYEPDFTPGTVDGTDYDFVMRDIRGNHVALVEEGRAGPDVVVADSKTVNQMGGPVARKKFRGAYDEDPITQVEEKLVEAPVDTLQEGKETPAEEQEQKAAMDEDQKQYLLDCGLDADDPEAQKAFEAGVEYAEKLAAEKPAEEPVEEPLPEDEDIPQDGEVPAEDEEEAEDDDPISEVIAKVPNLSDEQKEALTVALQQLAGKLPPPPAADEEEAQDEEKAEPAMDRALRAQIRTLRAQVAGLHMERAKEQAAKRVMPLVGKVNVSGFANDAAIYAYALRKNGVNVKGKSKAYCLGRLDELLRKQNVKAQAMAADSAAIRYDELDTPFANVKNIIISQE